MVADFVFLLGAGVGDGAGGFKVVSVVSAGSPIVPCKPELSVGSKTLGETVASGVGSTSVPIGANGFGLPWVPSGVRVMLESRSVLKAESEKIVSSNLIFLTFKRTVKKSAPVAEAELVSAVVDEELDVVVRLATGIEGFKKNT